MSVTTTKPIRTCCKCGFETTDEGWEHCPREACRGDLNPRAYYSPGDLDRLRKIARERILREYSIQVV